VVRRRTLVPLLVVCAGVAAVLGYGLTHQDDANNGPTGINPAFHRYAAPALPQQTLRDRPFSLQALRGKPVVVNFWGSWCGPCRREVPELVKVADRYAGRVSFVGVDVGDSTSKALKFARAHGIRYPLVPDPSYEHALDWRAGGTPWTFIVDKRGEVVDQLFGQTTAAALSKKLDDLLSA
jgi:cytochrome c biogenesis protein CcmG/thiol:disulfide interchange protein DsbE